MKKVNFFITLNEIYSNDVWIYENIKNLINKIIYIFKLNNYIIYVK